MLKWMKLSPVFSAMALTAFMTCPAAARNPDNAELCIDVHGQYTPDQVIAGCTVLLDAGKKDSWIYNNRGKAHDRNGDGDRAVADYDEAIRLYPGFVLAHANRGEVYFRKGDNERAIADFTDAIRFGSKDARTYTNRALAYFRGGDFDRAAADSAVALRRDKTNPSGPYLLSAVVSYAKSDYAAAARNFLTSYRLAAKTFIGYPALGQFLARAHLKQDGIRELRAVVAAWPKDEKEAWPNPVMEFYLGRRTLDGLRSYGERNNNDFRCGVSFYVGEWRLVHDDRDGAISDFQTAIDTCNKTGAEESFYYVLSRTEMKRIRP